MTRRSRGRVLGQRRKVLCETTHAPLRPKSLPYFTTHADLVARQKAAKAKGAHGANRDAETCKGAISKETDSLTTN